MKAKASSGNASHMIEHPSTLEQAVHVIVVLACVLVAFCCVIPMWHVMMSSVSDGRSLMAHKGVVWLPVGGFTLDGFKHIFADAGIVKGYLNTIFYTVTSTVLGFLISATGGYALSRQTKLKSGLSVFVMITMLFGGGLVPTYMVVKALGWVDTPWAIIVPGCTNAMFIIMMMNAFNSVPHEMYEAARIDGAGHFRIMGQILLPQAMNLGSVILLNSVVIQWNSWLPAAIYAPNKKDLWPLQLWIRQITSQNNNFLQSSNPDYSLYLVQYAVIVAAILPIIIVFPFFQDKLEKGVISGGVKG